MNPGAFFAAFKALCQSLPFELFLFFRSYCTDTSIRIICVHCVVIGVGAAMISDQFYLHLSYFKISKPLPRQLRLKYHLYRFHHPWAGYGLGWM